MQTCQRNHSSSVVVRRCEDASKTSLQCEGSCDRERERSAQPRRVGSVLTGWMTMSSPAGMEV